MKEKLTVQDVTLEVKEAVARYLALRTIAEVTRKEVDAVGREVLENVALYDDLDARHMKQNPQRIYDPGRTWLSEDEEALNRYYDAVDAALRANGLKPDDMERDFCPALVAEHNRLKAEWTLLDAAGRMMDLGYNDGELNDRLLCNAKGLERRQQFIDLVVGLVVNLPN